MDEDLDKWVVTVDADTGPLQRELVRVTSFGQQFGRSLTRAFEGLALRGRSFGDVVRNLGQQLSQLAFRAAFKPLEKAVGGFFDNLFAGGVPFGGGGPAKPVVPFAAGGVVAAPTYFSMGGGGAGVMGEAGPEAILPLRRGSDGRLGVAAQAGGGVSINFNVTSQDAESFSRSEAQIAAMVSRAVSRGQRIL